MIAPLANAEVDEPELFGYKIGQRYEVSQDTERRLHGVIVVESGGLDYGLEELLLTVTPKTHTIVSISGTLKTSDREKIRRISNQYRELLKVDYGELRDQPGESAEFSVYKLPFHLQGRTWRTRTEGLFEYSVSLEYAWGTPERRDQEALRFEEARQIIAEYQSGTL